MSVKHILRRTFMLAAIGPLSGCGLYTPMMELNPEPHITGFLANKIVGHVKCELGRAILDEIAFDIEKAKTSGQRQFPWLDDWSGTLTITMIVEEKGTALPGLSWSEPLASAQSFTLGLGASASADAMRKQQIDYVFNIKDDFIKEKDLRRYDPKQRVSTCEPDGEILIEGDLQIRDWLDSVLFPYKIPDNVDAKAPDVLTDDVTFTVSIGANATPSAKLVRFSVNPNSPFVSATRTRTNEALIALGPTNNDKGKGGKTPSQSVLEFRNVALIGSALNISVKAP